MAQSGSASMTIIMAQVLRRRRKDGVGICFRGEGV